MIDSKKISYAFLCGIFLLVSQTTLLPAQSVAIPDCKSGVGMLVNQGCEVTHREWFSWQIAIVDNYPNREPKKGFVCGGVIVGSRWIATAAHCICNSKLEELSVFVGDNALNNINSRRINISYYYEPEFYNFDSFDEYNMVCDKKEYKLHHDIVLLHTEEEVVIDEMNYKKIKIMNEDQEKRILSQNSKVSLSGWGQYYRNSGPPETLLYGTMVLSNSQDCAALKPDQIIDFQTCAIEPVNGSCPGDSGGGVVILDPDFNEYRLAGINSYGPDRCGDPGINVFSRVPKYSNWMERIMSRHPRPR